MERTNNQRAELIAIYRLEFYKKQKSWKFNKDANYKKYKPENKKHILNITYDVEQPTTQSGLLNDAFIDTASDNDKSNTQCPSLPMETESEIKRASLSNNHSNSANNCSSKEQCINSYPWIHPVLKLQRNDLENACSQECFNTERDLLNFHSYPEEFQTGYLFDSNENLMHTSSLNQLLYKDPQMIPEMDCGDNASNILCFAGNRPLDECLWLPDEADLCRMNDNAEGSGWSELSSDSWLDFMRGADMAPHSSKVELTLPNAFSDLEVSGDALARLSSVQLEQAVRAHTQLLRRLLREETHRRRLRSCLSLTGSTIERPQFSPRPATDFCIYEQPTRDFGPYLYNNTSGNALQRFMPDDIFIAGSYKSELEVLGRGRGRLRNINFDTGDRILGKGRGRPFRLT